MGFCQCKEPGCCERKKYADRIVRREKPTAKTTHLTIECDKGHRWIITLLALLLAACSAEPEDSHDLRAATKELCEYRYDCLGMERDYDICEAEVEACGPDVVLACEPLGECEAVAECLELECGRGAGTGLEP